MASGLHAVVWMATPATGHLPFFGGGVLCCGPFSISLVTGEIGYVAFTDLCHVY